MGTDPTNDDYDSDLECPLCVDLLFGGDTPKYVEADIFGIIQCPGKPAVPNDTTVLLTQTLPCQWEGATGVWSVTWRLLANDSRLIIATVVLSAFSSIIADDCIDAFVNQNVDCVPAGRCGRDGFVTLWWGPTIGP